MAGRREVLRAGLCGAALLWARRAAGGARAEAGGDWPASAGGLDAWRAAASTVPHAAERWRKHLDGGVTGTAALVGGRVFAASLGGELLCCDLDSGGERWRRKLPTQRFGSGVGSRELGFFGGPAVSQGRIVVASDRVFCLDSATGSVLWETEPLRGRDGDDYFWGAPVVAGGLVLVGAGAALETGTTRGRVCAYDLRDGSLRWGRFTVPEGGNGGGVLAPCSADLTRGVLYVATGAPYAPVAGPNPGTASLLELRLRDGALLWADQLHPHDSLRLNFNSAPLLLGHLAIAAGKTGLCCWDRLARRRLWSAPLTSFSAAPGTPAGPLDGPENGPVASDGRSLFALSNDRRGNCFVAAALAPEDGRVLWRQRFDGAAFSAPAVADGTVWIAAADGTLRCLRAADGAVLSSAALREPSACGPSIAHGALVVGTGAGPYLRGDSLVCFG